MIRRDDGAFMHIARETHYIMRHFARNQTSIPRMAKKQMNIIFNSQITLLF